MEVYSFSINHENRALPLPTFAHTREPVVFKKAQSFLKRILSGYGKRLHFRKRQRCWLAPLSFSAQFNGEEGSRLQVYA